MEQREILTPQNAERRSFDVDDFLDFIGDRGLAVCFGLFVLGLLVPPLMDSVVILFLGIMATAFVGTIAIALFGPAGSLAGGVIMLLTLIFAFMALFSP